MQEQHLIWGESQFCQDNLPPQLKDFFVDLVVVGLDQTLFDVVKVIEEVAHCRYPKNRGKVSSDWCAVCQKMWHYFAIFCYSPIARQLRDPELFGLSSHGNLGLNLEVNIIKTL